MKDLLLPFLLFCCFSSFSQPILNAANTNLAVGDIFYHHECDTGGIAIDAGGAGHVWNYGALAVTKTDTVNVVSCSSTPYADSFPAANVAVVYAPASIGYCVTTTGFATDAGSYSDQVGYIYILRHDTMKYPVSYPMSWNDTTLEVYDTTYASSHLFREGKRIVDGYGTLILPSGIFTNVLRIHSVVYLTDSNYGGSGLAVYHYRTDGYAWYVPGFHFPLLTMEVDNDLLTGAIEDIYYIVYTTGPGIAALSVAGNHEANISIYPNPVRDLIYVNNLPDQVNYWLENIVGTELKHGILNNAENVVDVHDLTGGMYLLKIADATTGIRTTEKIIKQ